VLADLKRLLEEDGLVEAPVMATSAKQPGMLTELRETLEKTVAERQAALRRLSGDLDTVSEQLAGMIGPPAAEDEVDRATVRQLGDALAASAGVPAVAAATANAYRHRAAASTGWPVLRGLRRFRPDPLRRLHLDGTAPPELAATSLPESTAAQRAAVALASRGVADRVGEGLPEPWPEAVLSASRSRLRDVPDALDLAVASANLGMPTKPFWWRLVGALQWLGALAALAGLAWLVLRYVLLFLGLPDLHGPELGRVPMPTSVRPRVASSARIRRSQARASSNPPP